MIWNGEEIKFKFSEKKRWYYARYNDNGIVCEITFKEQYKRVMNTIFFCYDVAFAIGDSIKACEHHISHDNNTKFVTTDVGIKYLIWAYSAIQKFERYAKKIRGKRKKDEGIVITVCGLKDKKIKVGEKALAKLGYKYNYFDSKTLYSTQGNENYLYKVVKMNGRKQIKL